MTYERFYGEIEKADNNASVQGFASRCKIKIHFAGVEPVVRTEDPGHQEHRKGK